VRRLVYKKEKKQANARITSTEWRITDNTRIVNKSLTNVEKFKQSYLDTTETDEDYIYKED
jgi:hypothetical protein